jgi:hypothetical protein
MAIFSYALCVIVFLLKILYHGFIHRVIYLTEDNHIFLECYQIENLSDCLIYIFLALVIIVGGKFSWNIPDRKINHLPVVLKEFDSVEAKTCIKFFLSLNDKKVIHIFVHTIDSAEQALFLAFVYRKVYD